MHRPKKFEQLPNTVVEYTLRFLDTATLARVAQTSRLFKQKTLSPLKKGIEAKVKTAITQQPRLVNGENHNDYFNKINDGFLFYLHQRDSNRENVNNPLPSYFTRCIFPGDIPLLVAAREGFEQVAKWIISKNPHEINKIKKDNPDQSAALHEAADNNHLEIADQLLDAGAEINMSTVDENKNQRIVGCYSTNVNFNYGRTAFFLATEKGHLNMMRLLINRGADINIERIKITLISRGSENCTDKYHYTATPIIIAAAKNHVDCVRLLLEQNATLTFQSSLDYFISDNYRRHFFAHNLQTNAGVLLGIAITKEYIEKNNLDLANQCIETLQKSRRQIPAFISALKEILGRNTFPCRFNRATLYSFLTLPAMEKWLDSEIMILIGNAFKAGTKVDKNLALAEKYLTKSGQMPHVPAGGFCLVM